MRRVVHGQNHAEWRLGRKRSQLPVSGVVFTARKQLHGSRQGLRAA
ncbi:MAG: hypothetical protein WBM34_11165 [Woeseiaceae bacterium]